MGDASYNDYHSYKETEEDQRRQAEVEMHLQMKQDAYDRYMDMLMKRAYETVSKDNQMATKTEPEMNGQYYGEDN